MTSQLFATKMGAKYGKSEISEILLPWLKTCFLNMRRFPNFVPQYIQVAAHGKRGSSLAKHSLQLHNRADVDTGDFYLALNHVWDAAKDMGTFALDVGFFLTADHTPMDEVKDSDMLGVMMQLHPPAMVKSVWFRYDADGGLQVRLNVIELVLRLESSQSIASKD